MTLNKREWLDIEDPKDHQNTWQFDLTFLNSNWFCSFGSGCKGIETLDNRYNNFGCCSHGAQFHDVQDLNDTLARSTQLDDTYWQLKKHADEGGIYIKDEDGINTRVIDGACIFFNRDNFSTGPGCAFHYFAQNNNLEHIDVMPMVCWQLPIAQEINEDENGNRITKITEFTRESWGDGGEDFSWWCTESTDNFTADSPVYISMKNELKAIVGESVYNELSKYIQNANIQTMVRAQALLQITKKTS